MTPNLESQNTAIDHRCELCGDTTDTYLARVTEHHRRTVCYNGEACLARQRWSITPAGRQALAAIEQGEQLRMVAS